MNFLARLFRRPVSPSDAARTMAQHRRDNDRRRKLAFHDEMAARFGKPPMPRRQS